VSSKPLNQRDMQNDVVATRALIDQQLRVAGTMAYVEVVVSRDDDCCNGRVDFLLKISSNFSWLRHGAWMQLSNVKDDTTLVAWFHLATIGRTPSPSMVLRCVLIVQNRNNTCYSCVQLTCILQDGKNHAAYACTKVTRPAAAHTRDGGTHT
jgi:hypothetical protein